jgi:hypothetical protein
MNLPHGPSSQGKSYIEGTPKTASFREEFIRLWKQVVGSRYCWILELAIGLIVSKIAWPGGFLRWILVVIFSLLALLALISFGIFLYAAICRLLEVVRWYLQLRQKFTELSDQVLELRNSIPGLFERMAMQLLVLASLPHSADEIPIVSIADRHGTVHLLLELPGVPETFMGMRLMVLTRAGGALCGEVEITRVDGHIGYAVPVNRVDADFWEDLEQRMRQNRSAPGDVVVKAEMQEVLAQLKRALRYEEVTNNEQAN